MNALTRPQYRCPKCRRYVEDKGLCVQCWDKEAETHDPPLPSTKIQSAEYRRAYYLAHRGEIIARNIAYRKANWLKLYAERQRRRIRKGRYRTAGSFSFGNIPWNAGIGKRTEAEREYHRNWARQKRAQLKARVAVQTAL